MNEQQKVSEAVARVTADLERGVYLTRTIQNNPRPVAYVLIDDVRTLLAELDQLRQRVAELELLNRQLRQDFDNAAWEAEAKLALAEQDLLCFQRFTKSIMPLDEEWIGDVDGGAIQDTAEACGLLQPVEVTEACGDGCNCASYDDFPQTCYRPTEAMKRAIAAIDASGETSA